MPLNYKPDAIFEIQTQNQARHNARYHHKKTKIYSDNQLMEQQQQNGSSDHIDKITVFPSLRQSNLLGRILTAEQFT